MSLNLISNQYASNIRVSIVFSTIHPASLYSPIGVTRNRCFITRNKILGFSLCA